MFQGFSQETIDFLWGIRLNNHRAWFLEHKKDYETYLYRPLKELGAQVQETLLSLLPEHRFNLKVTRIYRDVRRPHKDGPYKTHLWFVLHESSQEWSARPALYFEIFPEGYEVGMGYYCAKPSMMQNYRDRVQAKPEELEALARRLNDRGEFHLEGEEYKRSKGEVSDLLKPWFNRKGICVCSFQPFQEEEPAFTPDLANQITEKLLWLMPFYDYFMTIGERAAGEAPSQRES